MRPLSAWTKKIDADYSHRRVVAFDLDDTLTTHGALPAFVVDGLEKVQRAGWTTVLVTGRPAGWADAIVKLLPFDAVVSENGAVLHIWSGGKPRRTERQEPLKLYWRAPGQYGAKPPSGTRDKHRAAVTKILKAFPRAKIASDQPYRLYDLAIDFAEEVSPPLSLLDAQKIASVFESIGAQAKVSSIHVNGWWGTFSKGEGLHAVLAKLKSSMSLKKSVVYVGDSPNDGPLFILSGVSIGVANVKAFSTVDGFEPPQFVTKKERSEGALEVLKRLEKTRVAPDSVRRSGGRGGSGGRRRRRSR